MSFLSDTVLPGSSRLHIGGATPSKDNRRSLRKSQSHAGLLTPLVHLVKDPLGTIAGVGAYLENVPEIHLLEVQDEAHRQALYLRMRNAESYEEWKAAATELDTLEGNDAWKNEDQSDEYDTALVAARLKQLDEARISCDAKKMLFLIRTALTRGLGGMGDLRLYKHSHIGTKVLIERYIESAQKTLAALLEVSSIQGESCPVDQREMLEALLRTRQSFGRSALLLSGGGTFGMNHIGVVKSLWKARLLPRIISGASAGSIVCAVLCSKTDAEIPAVLEQFCYGDLAVFEKEGEEDGMLKKAARFMKYGSLFDISHLMNVMRNLLGDITFQESYNRTRRILNITVSSASLYELPRLLNYVTAPNVMIWSAVCASCSVPFIFSAASILAKDPKTGKEVPWNQTPNAGWIDGSVDNDLPMTRLAEMFNVNHFIVSQVNPHVVPFLAKEEEVISAEAQQTSAFSAGPNWIHNMANLAKGEALHRLSVLSELGIFPNYLTKARSVLNQRYSGDITIFPSISYAHFPKVLSNPTTEYMLQCMLTGERATWPKLSRVQNHVSIELALDDTIRQFRARVVFSPSQIDLRLNNFSRPLSQGNDRISGLLPSKSSLKATRTHGDGGPSAIPRHANHARIRLPPHQMTRPYLPTHPLRKHTKSLESSQPSTSTLDAFSSSTNPEGTSSEGEEGFTQDTDASELLSSPSPPGSPSGPGPTLWPSTRQLFPSASQPSTPSASASMFDRRNSSILNLTMTPSTNNKAPPPSSPELRYKRLFHPPLGVSQSDPVHPDTQRQVEDTIQTHAQGLPTLHQTESVPEAQRAVPTLLFQSDSYPESELRAHNTLLSPTLTPTPRLNPLPTRNTAKPTASATSHAQSLSSLKKAMSKQEHADFKNAVERERRSGRRGSAQDGLGMMLDISGTRGMLLRRKKSAIQLAGSGGSGSGPGLGP